MISQTTGSYDTLLEALDVGATVVTANNRLARYVGQLHDDRKLQAGQQAWVTPDILPWGSWVQRLWEEACLSGAVQESPLLLTPEQERYLWEQIISQSVVGGSLNHLGGTVRDAQEAWKLIRGWRLPLRSEQFNYNANSEAFWEWASAFKKKCDQSGWLPEADLVSTLETSIREARLRLSGRLFLCGFDEFNPQQEELLEAVHVQGTEVQIIRLAGEQTDPLKVRFSDRREEAERMARWVRWQLETHDSVRIGIVVPNLSDQRERIVQALDEMLVPSCQQPGGADTARPYNLSLGLPLSQYPMVATALQLCRWAPPNLQIKSVSQVIRSPFIAQAESEAGPRALLDAKVREAGEPAVALQTLLCFAAAEGKPYCCPQLSLRLQRWSLMMGKLPRKQRLGFWAEHFAELLSALGWAEAERGLSSEEYQTLEAWQALLRSFASLETVATPVSRQMAVECLQRLADERTFQPKTDRVPVQVLGIIEATGMQFDYLWILGLHSGLWPVVSQANPFIPLPLQRKAQMPHSSAERELMVARRLTNRLLESGRQTVVSAPSRDGDEVLMMSPLVEQLTDLEPEALPGWSGSTWRRLVQLSGTLVELQGDLGPPVDSELVPWGSAIFKLQAACPFRAFAELRLGARSLGQTQLGLSASARGTLTHRTLEKLWSQLVSQQRLLETTDEQLEALVHCCVEQAIDDCARSYPQTFSPRFRALESQRLSRQIMEWLEIEKSRPSFQVILREQGYEANVGGLRVHVRVDRVDELSDGRLLVVDYKTGDVRSSQWIGERPDEPQLPLYSLVVDGPVAGVIFAQVKSGRMGWLGLSEEPDLVPGAIAYDQWRDGHDFLSWQDLLDEWKDTIARLGSEFRMGDARVDPKQFPTTCMYCDLQSLCRVGEHRFLKKSSCGEDAL